MISSGLKKRNWQIYALSSRASNYVWQLFKTRVSKGRKHTLHVYVIWQHSWPETVDLSFITVIHQFWLFVQEPLLYISKTKVREKNILIMQNQVTFMFINPSMEE